ncbi:MAG TPA: GNAT family N-acetyltransferase [Ramlibacter sp.]|nr:GNAT family N-acetyltransferase [Ramlibacter sp.]
MGRLSLAGDPRVLEAVASWHHGQWAGPRGESLPQVQERLRERLRRGAGETWVYLADGKPAATARLLHDENPIAPGNVLLLADLLVAPEWRGQGIGRALCAHMVALARQERAGPLHALTVDRVDFFRKVGFRCLADTVVTAIGRTRVLASLLVHDRS